MTSSILFAVGLGLVVAGVALVYVPAGLVIGGFALAVCAVLLERGQKAPDLQ